MMTPEERKLLSDLFERMRPAASAPRDREAEEMISEAVRAQPYAPYLLAQAVLVQEEGLKAAASRIQELETQLAEQRREQEGSGGFLGGIGKSIFGGGPSGARPTSVPQAGGQWSAPPTPPPRQGPWGPGPGGAGPGQAYSGAAGGFGGAPGPFGGGGFGGGGGGGFLRGALTTAAGVAGGALLFQGISNLFGSAHAAGPLAQSMADPSAMAAQTGVNDIFNSLPGAEHSQAASLHDAAADDTADDSASDDAGYDDAGYEDDGGDDGGFDSGGDDGGDWT